MHVEVFAVYHRSTLYSKHTLTLAFVGHFLKISLNIQANNTAGGFNFRQQCFHLLFIKLHLKPEGKRPLDMRVCRHRWDDDIKIALEQTGL
jgi:hypothetical protein